MANNHVAIDQTKLFGAELAQSLRNAKNAHMRLMFLKDKADQMIAGADYTAMESNFGLATGKGQTVYNLISGALTSFGGTAGANDINLRDLLSWVGVPP
jgi:hypothetical protein